MSERQQPRPKNIAHANDGGGMHPPAPLEQPLVTLMCCSDDVILGIGIGYWYRWRPIVLGIGYRVWWYRSNPSINHFHKNVAL